MTTTRKRCNVVVLGAGYAGLRAALSLAQQRTTGLEVAITLVDQQPYHQLVVLLHQLVAETASPAQVALPLDNIIGSQPIALCQGRVQLIDLDNGVVRLEDGATLPYDQLIIALGSTTGYGNVPGAREHTLPLRTYREAQALYEQLVARYRAAQALGDPTERRRAMTVVVVGGGYTGIQLAGELGSFLPQLATRLELDPADVRLALLDRNAALLPQLGNWANDEAARTLTAQNVALYLNTAVEAVEPGALLLDGKRRMRAGTIVWAGGVVAPLLLEQTGLPTAKGGRVVVDDFLRADERGGRVVYAAGDCAFARDGAGRVLPANASYALRQGDYLARQIAAKLRGEPTQPYAPITLGEVVSLGPGRAVGNPLGLPVSGLPAALLKRGIEAWYLTTLEPGGSGPII